MLELLRNLRRKCTIDNGNRNYLWKWLQHGSAKRFGVVESTNHALNVVGLAADEAMEEQNDTIGIAALAEDGGIVGLLAGR